MRVEDSQSNERTLAFELRSRDLGFAVFEGSSRLRDYGRRKHRVNAADLTRITSKRIRALLDLHQPSTIVLRERAVISTKARRRLAKIVRVVHREAKKRAIPVQRIGTKAIHRFFAPCKSKQQIALTIARWFPELSWKVPPHRKKWKGEHHRIEIFDAIATALTFLNRSPPTEL